MNIQAIPDKQTIKSKFDLLRPFFDERLCRRWAATEARALGRGGASAVAAATGITYSRILVGLRELEQREAETTTESSCGLSPPPFPRARTVPRPPTRCRPQID